MRPGDTESHRHCPQPARTRRCSRTRLGRPAAGFPRWLHAGRLATTTPTIAARFGRNPRDLGQFPFTRNGNCPRSAGSHQPDRAIRFRRPAIRFRRPANYLRRAPAGIAASTPGRHPAPRHPPRPASRRPRPTTNDQRPATGDRRPATSDQRPGAYRTETAPGAAASAPGRRRDVRDQRPCPTETEVPLAGTPGWGCRPAVGVVRWCLVRWFCDVSRVSCSSAGRPGRWPAAPTGRRRPGRPTPARSARRRSAACPATRQPASGP
ncbi:hypothetical protein MED15_06518 [Micromonospora noduli]|uniref:Uncharacterized protein n=1 Tax=Micromonospora noduli TaxID=709876 RepID=A0ABX9CU68_9ACTN|nr:hypothetical protein MED15_06518 [Micromonospora noduli]